MHRTVLTACALVLWAFGSIAAKAQSPVYPTQTIRMVVPFGPGGAADLVARPLVQHLAEILGQSIVIENRPGANGVIGINAVAKAAADGYTLLLTTGGFSANPWTVAKLPYDAMKDFAPITQIAGSYGLLLAVRPDHPAKDLKSLVEMAKAKPGSLNYAMLGPGNQTHVTVEAFKSVAGVDIVAVPYKSSAENVNAVLAGQVDMAPLSSNTIVPFLAEKKLRALGIAGAQRAPATPDIPTFREQGYDVAIGGYFGMWFPAGTPRERIEIMHRAVVKAMQTPAMQKFFVDGGYRPVASTPAEFTEFLVKDIAEQGALLRRIGLVAK